MSQAEPGEVRAALPAAPPRIAASRSTAILRDLDEIDHAGPVALAAPALLRLLPLQRRAFLGARRFPEHRLRRARPLVAVEPGADRARGGRRRLDAPDGRPLGRVERGHPGHRLDQHAGRAHLRARAEQRLRACAAAACKAEARRSSSTPRRQSHSSVEKAALLAGFGRDNVRLHRPPTSTSPCAPTRSRRRSPPTSPPAGRPARWSPPPATTPPPRSIRSRRSRERARRHGLWLHVDAAMAGSAMILPECRWMWDGGRGRRLARVQSAQVARRRVRLLALLRARRRAPRPGDEHQSELSAAAASTAGEEPARLGHPARPPLPRAQAVVPAARAGRRSACRRACGATRQRDAGSPARCARAAGWRLLAPVPLQTLCVRHEPAGPRTARRSTPHARLGRAAQPLRRRLPDAGDARRPLDGARLDRRAADRARACEATCGGRCARKPRAGEGRRRARSLMAEAVAVQRAANVMR